MTAPRADLDELGRLLADATIICETPKGCTCGAPADTPAGMHHCDCAVHPGWCGSDTCLPCVRNGKTTGGAR